VSVEKDLGSKLKSARNKKGFSLREVQKLTDISPSYLSQIENGNLDSYPSKKVLHKLCELYGIKLSSLFGEEIPLPDDLKDIGVEWITFAEEMKKENLTPDEIKEYIDLVKRLKNL
jgi:transcriptional regulator with XRE-family HTH domain